MEPDFWLQRWHSQEIGFHLDYVHPLLKRYWASYLQPAPVLVPLCGKSLDLLYLKQQGCPVIGVEISQLAIKQFERENGLNFKSIEHHSLNCFYQQDLSLFHTDIFNITAQHLPRVDQVYDRAALIALPPDVRKRYIKHLLSILPRPLNYLLITLEYPQHQMSGPPFSVTKKEVTQLFNTASSIEQIHYNSIIEKEPRFKSKGVSELYECAYSITIE